MKIFHQSTSCILLCLFSVLILLSCSSKMQNVLQIHENSSTNYFYSVPSAPILGEKGCDWILPTWNKTYTGDSLFMVLESCYNLSETQAKLYNDRFLNYSITYVSYAQTITENEYLVLGITHRFEMSKVRVYSEVIGFHVYCPICTFLILRISPEEANSYRNDFDYREIAYLHHYGIDSRTANKFERPLRARDLTYLIIERPDIPIEFINKCEFEKAENIIAIYESGVPLKYANTAKPLIERFVDRHDSTAQIYSVKDLSRDYRNGMSIEDLKSKVKKIVKPKF